MDFHLHVTSQRQSALQHNVEVNDQDELKNQSRLIADSEEDIRNRNFII
jgi:S-DNA-T family DNA segregation ATPase FtsK/SpoIIIE